MKIRKILFSVISTLACVSATYAQSLPQFYLGAQGGFVDTGFGNSSIQAAGANAGTPITSVSIHNHVFGGRGYAGVLFNPYIALEGGYFRPSSTRFTNINGGAIPNGDISEYGIDISGKVFLPMAAYIHLSPYLKIGGAYMNGTSHGGITANSASDFGYSFNPLFGAGIGYGLTPYLTMDISWTTITKRSSQLPKIDMIFLGLTYHFSLLDSNSGVPNYGDVNNDDP